MNCNDGINKVYKHLNGTLETVFYSSIIKDVHIF